MWYKRNNVLISDVVILGNKMQLRVNTKRQKWVSHNVNVWKSDLLIVWIPENGSTSHLDVSHLCVLEILSPIECHILSRVSKAY